MVLLSICLNPSNLSAMGPPFNFCIIYLKKWISKAKQESPTSISYPLFKFHNTGKGLEMH